MKKLILIIAVCLMTLSVQAQRCVVLEFKAGVGITQNDADGLFAIFTIYFQPAGYSIIERTQVDKAIEEHGFQRTKMTLDQIVRLGKTLGASDIVMGDINVVIGEYNLDTRIISVESGTVYATEGATFATSDYRAGVKSVAQSLAQKIGTTPIVPPATTSAPASPTKVSRNRDKVEILYGYLKIFPNELGVFQSEPVSVIAHINKQSMHGYSDWRIPTDEELALLRANNYIGDDEYMSKENNRGIVLLVTDGQKQESQQELTPPAIRETTKDESIAKEEKQEKVAPPRQEEKQKEVAPSRQEVSKEDKQEEVAPSRQEVAKDNNVAPSRETVEQTEEKDYGDYVDLGLPSGTLWSKQNVDNKYYSYEQAFEKYGSNLPTKSQYEELKRECQWEWTMKGFQVTGPNGKSIFIPAAGYADCEGSLDYEGSYGNYWTSTTHFSGNVWGLGFNPAEIYFSYDNMCYGRTVRLVRSK